MAGQTDVLFVSSYFGLSGGRVPGTEYYDF